MGKNVLSNRQPSTPLRNVVRELESIGNQAELSGGDHLRLQKVIDQLMGIAKKYEPLSTREVKKV